MTAWRAILAAALLALTPAAGAAAYTPDKLTLHGGDCLSFPADSSLDLSGGGTIEFWVAPGWSQDPGYDPVVVSNIGVNGASYMVVVRGDRKGIGLQAGSRYAWAPFDFTDGNFHYVTITDYGDQTLVMVDNQIAGVLPVVTARLASSGFFIGCADGQQEQFTGGISALRIWHGAVDPDVLAAYAMQPVPGSPTPHPSLAELIGRSAFAARRFDLVTREPVPTDANLTLAP